MNEWCLTLSGAWSHMQDRNVRTERSNDDVIIATAGHWNLYGVLLEFQVRIQRKHSKILTPEQVKFPIFPSYNSQI